MANGGSFKYSVGFNVDKTGLNQMKASLQELLNLTKQDLIKINSKATDAELDRIKKSAKDVESALERAFNPNLGTLNVSKFNQELKRLDVKRIYDDFNLAQQAGRNAFRNITTDILTTNMQLKQTHTLLDKMAETMGNTIKWGIASGAMNTVTRSAQQAYGYVKSLDNSLNDIVIVTGKSSDEMAKFAVQANKAAKALAASTTSYTDASLIYYQQGLTDAEVAARAEVTLKAANVTGQSADAVSEQLTAVWNGYKVSAEEAELYIDKLAAVAATTASNLEELSTGMSKVASAANLMGVDADQLNAQLATIVSVTRQAPESVGTALKTIYARMGDIEAGIDSETTLGNYTEAMAQMGFNVLDMNGKLRDMGEVIEEIGEKWGTMSREQQLSLSQTIAGTRQYNNLLSLFDNWGMYTKALETSSNAAGTLQEQQDRYMERTTAHLQQLKTATEDVYDSLFDPKELNKLIDGVTDVVELFGNLVDVIGGGKGALLLLGSVGSQVFGKQIANGLATTIMNINTVKENAAKLQAEIEILNQFDNADINDTRTQHLINMKQQQLDLTKSLTVEERNISNEYIKQQNELYKQRDVLNETTKEAVELYEHLTGESVVIGPNGENSADLGKKLKQEAEEFKYYIDETKRAKQAINELTKARRDYEKRRDEGNTSNFPHKDDALMQTVNNTKKAVQDYIKQLEKLKNSNKLTSEDQEKLTLALKRFYKEVGNVNKAKFEEGHVIAEVEKLYQSTSDAINHTSESAKKLGNDMEDLSDKIKKNEANVETLTQRWNSFIKTIDLRNTIQQFTTLVGKVGQIASGINTLSQITAIWKNEDLSTGEKVLQLTTSLSMGLPMLINGVIGTIDIYKKLNLVLVDRIALEKLKQVEELKSLGVENLRSSKDVLKNILQKAGIELTQEEINALNAETAAEIINAKAKTGVITADIESIALSRVKAVSEELEAASVAKTTRQYLLKKAAMIGPYLLAIGLVAGAVWLAVKSHNAEADALAKSKKRQEELAESYKKTKQAYENLQSSLDQYGNAKKNLDDMVKGTQEWREALQDVNDQVLELIQNFPELAAAVKNDGHGGLYIDKESKEYKNYLQQQQDNVQAQYRSSLQGAIDVNKNQLVYDTELRKRALNRDVANKVNEYNKQNAGVRLIDNSGISTYRANGAKSMAVETKTPTSINNETLLQVATLISKDKTLLNSNSPESFIKAITDAKIANEDVAQALWDSRDTWTDLANTIQTNSEVNKNLIQSKYNSYLSANEKFTDENFEYQNLVTGILANLETDPQYRAQAEEQYSELYATRENAKAEYQKVHNLTDEEMKKVKFSEIKEFLVSELMTSIVADTNIDRIMGDINKLTGTSLGKDLVTMMNSGANALSPEQIGELKNVTEHQLEQLYAHNEQFFKEQGYENSTAFVESFKKGIEEYDAVAYWTDKLSNIKNELSSFDSGISTLLTGGELSDEQLAQLEQLESKYKDLGAIQDKNSKAYLEKLIQIREALEEEQILAQQAIENEQIDKISEIDITANTGEFEQAMIDIAEQDYEVLVAVKADIQSDFDAVTTVMSNMEEMASKIGDNFIVAASDLEELNDAFPGILDGIKYLNDGTAQLSRDAVDAAMDGAKAEAAADTQKTIEKLRNQRKELEIKRDAAKAIANIAAKQVEGEVASETTKADIQEELDKLSIENSEAVSKTEQQHSIDTALTAADSAESMANNFSQAYAKMADDSAKWAEIAQHNFQVAQTGVGVPRSAGSDFTAFSSNRDNVGTVATSEPADLSSYENLDSVANWKAVQEYYENLAKSYDETINNIMGKEAELLGSSVEFAKKATDISKGLGSDGQKSNKDTMDLVKDQIDIYHDLDLELKNLSNSLSKLGKQEKKLFGQDLINNLNEQLGVLKAQTEVYQDKIDLAKEEASLYRSNLSSQGINFDSQGNVTNYVAAMKGKQDYLNSLISKYNSMSETEQKNFKSTVEQAKKDYEQFQKDMEYYEKLVSDTIPGLEEQIQDALDKQIEIQIQKFTMEVEIRLEMAEAEREWNEFKKKIIDDIDDDDILGNALTKVLDFSSYYKDNGKGIVQSLTKQVEETLDQLNQIDATGTSSVYGDNKAQAMEDLQKYYTELMSQLEDVHDLVDEIGEAYLDMIDEANEKFDEQIEKYETVSDLIEHNMKVIELLNGDDAYDQLSKYYELQERNNLKQLDFHRQEVAFWRERMESEEEGSEAWEAYRQNWQDAVSDLNATVEKSVEDLIAKYQNTVSGIFADLNDKITNGKGLNFVGEEWDLINKNADQYLDKINAMFEIQQLEGKYRDALDNTDTIAGQNKLNELMTEELNMLREKDKLTQYDIDRANLRYELALKEMALEDAKQSKSQMRLRRDAQGNYSYQFVADQDAISQAEQEVAAAQNDLYNLDKDKYQENLDEIYEVYVEFQEKLNELYMDSTLSDAEREEQKLLLVEQYGELINGLVEQNEDIRLNLQESALQAYADFQGTLLMDEIIPQWDSGVQEMADKFAGDGGFIPVCEEALLELDEATQDYEDSLEDLEDTAGISFDEIEDGIDKNIELTEDFIDVNDDLIDRYAEQVDALQEVQREVAELANKYAAAEKAAIAATEAAYKYWQQAKAMAADGIDTGVSSSRVGLTGYSGNSNYGSTTSNGGTSTSITTTPSKTPTADPYPDIKISQTGQHFNGKTGETYPLYSSWKNGTLKDINITREEMQKKYPGKSFKTGGYTGQWTNGDNDGRLALLHQKELVLNSQDTENVLSAVNIVRSMSDILQSVKSSVSDRISGLMSRFSGGNAIANDHMTIEQNVHIDAKFEGQTESHQIQNALINLVNYASQHAYDTKR